MNADSTNAADAGHRDRNRLSVHVLAEYLFCPRAGLLADEARGEDDGEEREPAGPGRLDWLPDYDLPLILQELAVRCPVIQAVFVLALIYGAFCTFLILMVDRRLGLCAAFPEVAAVYWLVRQALFHLELWRRRRAAEAAGAGVLPDPHDPRIRPVDWWEVRQAFDAMSRLTTPHVDPAGPLIGRPWAVLRHGSLVIPVFRTPRKVATLQPQQRGRIAAYCHLIEVCERAQAPYGIVLIAGSYDALIVPFTAEQQRLLDTGVQGLQELLSAQDQRAAPPPAPTDQRCRGCPWGRPDHALPSPPPHSVCGARFDWSPPYAGV